jgi:hypothetical protein
MQVSAGIRISKHDQRHDVRVPHRQLGKRASMSRSPSKHERVCAACTRPVTEDVTWDLHVAEAAKKEQAVFYMWARLLASSRLSVDLRIQQIIDARLRPVMEYGMEVWAPPDRALDSAMLAPLDTIVTKVCKLACGIRSTPTETATTRQRTVKQPVIEADTGMLPNGDRVDQGVESCHIWIQREFSNSFFGLHDMLKCQINQR